jgi:hypothetical protein
MFSARTESLIPKLGSFVRTKGVKSQQMFPLTVVSAPKRQCLGSTLVPGLDADDVVRRRAVVGELCGRRELGVLSFEVRFGYRTGSRAAASDVYGNSRGSHFAQNLSQVWPSHRITSIGYLALHEEYRFAHEEDLCLVPTFQSPFGAQEREHGSGWIIGGIASCEHKLSHARYLLSQEHRVDPSTAIVNAIADRSRGMR